jgi:phosphoglycolate phosphatase-like HAD superfamily hydrolase
MTQPAALLDVDGTLVDTNYHHALAWFRAFRDEGIILPVWRLHRHIGMGGDQLVGAVAGDAVDAERGDALRNGHSRHYQRLIDDVELMPGARRLIEVLSGTGSEVILASSAGAEDLGRYREMLDADDLIAGATSSADVEQTKPEPDLIRAALDKVSDSGGGRAVLVGDSTWDCKAARRAGVESVALLTGGFGEAELRQAGAGSVFASIADLLDDIAQTPLRNNGR